MTRVLVTGGTGYLARWVLVQLLKRGDDVRTTVRDPARADALRADLARHGVPTDALDVVVADLRGDAGWAQALDGVEVVVHTASPLRVPRGQDLVALAREGTRRVLTAAARAGARRAVATSSGVAALPDDPAGVAHEGTWATPVDGRRHAYATSKVLAERDAWEIARRTGLELVTVLPTFLQGPTVGPAGADGSTQVVARLLHGSLRAVPDAAWDVVDVRDVAELHVRATTSPQAAGRRLLASGEVVRWLDMARLLREALPQHADRVPTRTLPEVLVRALGRVHPDMARLSGALGRRPVVDGSVTRELMDWRPRPVRTTLVDTARALLDDRTAQAPTAHRATV